MKSEVLTAVPFPGGAAQQRLLRRQDLLPRQRRGGRGTISKHLLIFSCLKLVMKWQIRRPLFYVKHHYTAADRMIIYLYVQFMLDKTSINGLKSG